MPKSRCTHRVKVGEEAEGRGSIESEGQEVFEVELRLQRPSWDGEGSQERAALGRRTWINTKERRELRNMNMRDIFCPRVIIGVELH